MNIQKLHIDDPKYPKNLREIFDPPECLYYAGDLEVFKRKKVAIVGTRRSTPYGETYAYQFAKELSQANICVVSGLAYGIDSVAHQGALHGGGSTIAVLAQGLPEIRPIRHKKLADTILKKGGLLISEKKFGEVSFKSDYLVRNRLISGLSLGTVVIEAGVRSGAVNTANHALEQNREVMAVPGRINDEFSAGTNKLLRSGAMLVCSSEDIANHLGIELKREIQMKLIGFKKELFELLWSSPKSGPELGEIYENRLSDLYNTLNELELAGFIKLSSSNRYIVCGDSGGIPG